MVLVSMVSEDGVRYYNPLAPTFDDKGNIETNFLDTEFLKAYTVSLGHITNISALLNGKKEG